MPVIVHANWSHRSVCAVTLHGRAAGQEVINTFHFEATVVGEATFTSDALAASSANDVRDDWLANCKTAWLGQIATDYTLEAVGAQVLERPATYSHKLGESLAVPTGGAVGTDSVADPGVLPLSVCAVIRWRSLLATRHGHGRTYVSPLSAQLIDAFGTRMSLNATGIAHHQTFADLMVARYGDSGGHAATVPWDFTVYNRPYDSPKGAYARRVAGVLTIANDNFAYAGDVHHVESASVDSVLRQQRRRELGVGA